jgi:GDP-L-fucose synthase
MKKNDKIYLAGHRGLVGSTLLSTLQDQGYSNIITRDSQSLDLRNQEAVNHFFKTEKPDYVFLAAAKVGGIMANQDYPANFIYDNLMIAANVIHAAYLYQVKKLIFLGSSCIYPRLAPQPLKESALLTSSLEKTNEAYAIAKIAGLKLCEYYNQQYQTNFIAVMPTNLYGPGDNFDLETSHVLPALIRKFHEAKIKQAPTITLWGSGKPKREFLHVQDLAEALILLMKNYNDKELINIGTGKDLSIKELANKIKAITGYQGEIVWDKSKPDGTPKKLLNISKLKKLGWTPKIDLDQGLLSTYYWYVRMKDG